MAKRRTKRPRVTIEAALKLVGLSALRVSPGGQQVAFVRSMLRKNEKTRATSIWTVRSDGDAAKQLTRGPSDEQPCWSPDGKTLAFARKDDKEKPPQVFLLPLDGGEPRRLTSLDSAPEALRFLPSGRRLSFLAQTADNKAMGKRKERGDDARVFVSDEKPKRLWTASVKSGNPKACSPQDLAVWEYDWLPDGESAAVIYTEEPRLDAVYFRSRVGLVRAKTGKIRTLTDAVCRASGLRVSPDGKLLALVCGKKSDTPRGGQAWIADIESGQTTCLTPGLPATVQSIEWLPDCSGLLLLIAKGLRSALCVVDLGTPGELRPVCESLPTSIDGLCLASDGRRVFGVGEDLEAAPEVWLADVGSDESVKLTNENASAGRLRLGRSSVARWHSTEDFDIEGIVTLPPGFRKGRKYPTILQIHGGPAGRFREDFGLLPRQLLASEGYVVLMANPRGSSGYGPDFELANLQDWGGGDFRDLMTGLDALIQQGIADPDRLGVYGASYGGYMTAWTVTQTDRFKAAICQCGLSNLYSFHGQTDITPSFLELYMGASPYEDPERYRAHSAMTHINQVTTPTLFLHGERDVRVPIAQSYEMYWGLRHVGVDTEFVIYPREGHGIGETPHRRDLYGRVVGWLGKYL